MSAGAGGVELRLPPEVANVAVARLLVTMAARNLGMSEERVEDLRVAVSEATTNAIRAHQQSADPRPVVLHFGPGDGGFQVVVVDAGPGFEPVTPDAAAERDWRDESGLGVTIIRGLADDVAFDHHGGMRVDMRFSVGMDAS